MALPFNDPSQFVQYDGPNGPVAIPQQYASNFVLPPPPVALPPPAFDPSAPLPLPEPAMPPEPEGPAPSVFAPPTPQPDAPLVLPEERAQLPIPAPPRPVQQAPVAAQPPPTALDVSMGALQQRQDVARQRGEVESRAADAERDIYAEADKREADLTKARADEVAAEKKERDRAKAGIKDASDRYLNYKVDENRRWSNLSTPRKILAGIGVLLSGLGNALAKKGSASNGALDYIMATIKEDTRLQMDERAQLGAAVGMKKDELNDLRSQFSDSEAAFQAAYGTNVKWAANKLRTVASAAKSETAKLNGMDAAAELEMMGGQLIDKAEERNHSWKVEDRNYRLAASGQALQNQRFKREKFESDRSYEEGKRRWEAEQGTRDQEAQAAIATAKAKGGEAAEKQFREDLKDAEQRGINDPTTGEPRLQPEGRRMVERASELDAAAAKHPDPATAAALKNEATALRGEARIRHTVKGRTPEKAGDLSQAYAAAQTAHGLLSDIKAFRNKAGWESDLVKSQELQAMKSRYAASKAITGKALQLGSMDEGTNTMLDELFGGDPTAWKGTDASIDAAIAMLEQRTGNMLRAEGDRGAEGFKFPTSSKPAKTAADEAVQSVMDAKTPVETEKALGPSGITRSLYYPFGGSEESGRAKRDAASALATASFTTPGASKEQGKEFDRLVSLATTGDAKEAAKARNSLVALAVGPRKELRTPALASMAEAGMVSDLKRALSGISDKKERAFAESYWLPRAEAAATPVSAADLVRGAGTIGR